MNGMACTYQQRTITSYSRIVAASIPLQRLQTEHLCWALKPARSLLRSIHSHPLSSNISGEISIMTICSLFYITKGVCLFVALFFFIYQTINVTHCHKCPFCFCYSSSESCKLSVDVWFVRIWLYLTEIQFGNWSGGAKQLSIEKIAFKFVQIKSLAIHITNQKLSFDIFTVGSLQNIFMEHDLYLIY